MEDTKNNRIDVYEGKGRLLNSSVVDNSEIIYEIKQYLNGKITMILKCDFHVRKLKTLIEQFRIILKRN